jgi:hypothetical protein
VSLKVNFGDLDRDQLAFSDNLVRPLNRLISQFREVKEPFDVWSELHEHTERNDLGDRPRDNPADVIGKPNEWIFLQSLQRKRDLP